MLSAPAPCCDIAICPYCIVIHRYSLHSMDRGYQWTRDLPPWNNTSIQLRKSSAKHHDFGHFMYARRIATPRQRVYSLWPCSALHSYPARRNSEPPAEPNNIRVNSVTACSGPPMLALSQDSGQYSVGMRICERSASSRSVHMLPPCHQINNASFNASSRL